MLFTTMYLFFEQIKCSWIIHEVIISVTLSIPYLFTCTRGQQTSHTPNSQRSLGTMPGTQRRHLTSHTPSHIPNSQRSLGTMPGTQRRHLTALMWPCMESSTFFTVQKGSIDSWSKKDSDTRDWDSEADRVTRLNHELHVHGCIILTTWP